MRFNHLQPPFNDPGVRRALLSAINQPDYMRAVAGTDPAMWNAGIGFFPPASPMASQAGMAALTGPRDIAASRAALAPLAGSRIVLIGPADYPQVQALTEVAADMLRRLGLTIDYVPSDWATVVQRRTNRGPVGQGGWNLYCTFLSGLDLMNPGVNVVLRAQGEQAFIGWPNSPALEALREAWLLAPDLAAQQAIAAQVQEQAFADLPYIPLGQFFQPTAWRRNISGVLKGPTLFWNIRRAA